MNRYGTVLVAMLTLCVGAVFAQTLPEPRKGDTIGWHEVRAGETLSGITARYLGDAQLWPENHRLNPGIKDPDRLTPGQRIRIILAREIAARHAEVEQVSRRVEKKPRSDEWTKAKAGDQLVEREGLRTYPRSSAELGFDDGSNLVLTENSIVFLREYTSSLRRVDRSQIEVVDGGIDLAVTPKTSGRRDSEIEIVLGSVTAKPKASRTEDGRTRAVKGESDVAKLMVYGGASQVESGGVTVQVAKGMGTSVRQGEAPAPPERLLAAPKVLSPATGELVADVLDVSWSAVPRAAGYVLEVCRDMSCGRLVDRQENLTSTSARTSTLPAGELYLRVTARSRSGLDGFPSTPMRIDVARQIAGRVLIDRAGALDASTWTGTASTMVKLFSDDGNGMPDDADVLVAQRETDETGRFVFDKVENASYWVVVDSVTVSPPGTWFEQVAGPAGSLCATDDGGTERLTSAGPCFGGRRADVSDESASPATAEHVVEVRVADDAEVAALEIVFSPSVITTTVDASDAPQGSLRRFMSNAAGLSGEDVMRFVPRAAAENDDTWWTITLIDSLPPVDDEVVLDGRAFSSAGDIRDTNEGQVSEAMTVGAAGESLAVADRPELEIFADGAGRPLFARSGTLRIRNLAVYGAEGVDLTSTGILEVENSVVGVGADLNPPGVAPAAAIEVSGTGTAELSRTHVHAGGSFGILIRSDTSEASVSGKDVEIANCASGAGVRVASNGSSFERFHVSPCGVDQIGLAFELKGSNGADNQTCRGNSISESTIARHAIGVKLRVGAMDNAVERNLFEAVGEGVELEFIMGFWAPKGNLIRENVWSGSGETIALSGLEKVRGLRFFENAVSCADGGWAVDRALDFPGTISLEREPDDTVRVRALVCPESIIELYSTKGSLVTHLKSIRSDLSGKVDTEIDLPAEMTEVGVLATDKWNTSSRMSVHEIDEKSK